MYDLSAVVVHCGRWVDLAFELISIFLCVEMVLPNDHRRPGIFETLLWNFDYSFLVVVIRLCHIGDRLFSSDCFLGATIQKWHSLTGQFGDGKIQQSNQSATKSFSDIIFTIILYGKKCSRTGQVKFVEDSLIPIL